jgi:hypothetical protein
MAQLLLRIPGAAGALLLLSALVVLPGNVAGAAVIDLTYDSVMDMVRPDVHPNLAVHHNLQITISGQNDVAEHRDRNVK